MDSTTSLTLSTTTKNLDTNTKTPPQIHDGSPKRPRHHRPPPMPQQPITVSYRECLKNHAAPVGGHALDGCGEFMPSVISTSSDPTSLKCAACGCHRNFHRREAEDPNPNNNNPHLNSNINSNSNSFLNLHNNYHHYRLYSALAAPPSSQPSSSPSSTPSPSPNRSPSSPAPLPVSQLPPPNYYSSAPQMLLALTTGFSAPSDEHHHLHNHHHPDFNLTVVKASAENNNNNNNNSNSNSRKKRMRTKFSQEQKEKMSLFAEKAGWRMQKCDKRLVEDFCSEIGIGKRVFKVWMHNNKHVFRKGSSDHHHKHDRATANYDVNQSINGRDDDEKDPRANNNNNNNNNRISSNNNEGSRVNFHDFNNVMSSSPSS